MRQMHARCASPHAAATPIANTQLAFDRCNTSAIAIAAATANMTRVPRPDEAIVAKCLSGQLKPNLIDQSQTSALKQH
jgi:hypothetical protein